MHHRNAMEKLSRGAGSSGVYYSSIRPLWVPHRLVELDGDLHYLLRLYTHRQEMIGHVDVTTRVCIEVPCRDVSVHHRHHHHLSPSSDWRGARQSLANRSSASLIRTMSDVDLFSSKISLDLSFPTRQRQHCGPGLIMSTSILVPSQPASQPASSALHVSPHWAR